MPDPCLRRAWMPVCAAVLLALAGSGAAVPPPKAAALIEQARESIARGDGLGAELHLKSALAAGAKREDVAARMGEAFIYQSKPKEAREWLGPGKFVPDEAAHGFHLLGLLDHGEGNLAGAYRAYDKALALAPKAVSLWVDVGYLRYANGEHIKAIEAADLALSLDPNNVRALEFRGLIVRDQYGLAAGLPWLEAALALAPDDRSVLREYAATLGDLGRTRQMLEVSRSLLERDGRNARGLLLQAQLAARAGDASLARSLLNKTGTNLKDLPAANLLTAALELRTQNNVLAVQTLDRLVKLQPANMQAQEMLARAMYGAGDVKGVVARFGGLAARADASPYLLTVLARAHEILGNRAQAVPLLERASRMADRAFVAVPENQPIGALLAAGNLGGAEAAAEQMRAANPESADTQALAGDVQLLLGRGGAAAERYRLAARVRLPESMLRRYAAALNLAGKRQDASALVESYLRQSPSSPVAVRLAAGLAAGQGDWQRARQLLEYLHRNGGGQDVRLLADLAEVQLKAGDAEAAARTAQSAYALQPSNGAVARIWGLSLNALGERADDARALLAKAKALATRQ